MKQGMALSQKPTVVPDMVAVQSFAAAAEATAVKMIKEHGGDRNKIQNAIDKIADEELRREVSWATNWISMEPVAVD